MDFLMWQKTVSNPTLRFLFEFVLNMGLGIYIQRIGDRSNDSRVSHVGCMRYLDMSSTMNCETR